MEVSYTDRPCMAIIWNLQSSCVFTARVTCLGSSCLICLNKARYRCRLDSRGIEYTKESASARLNGATG